MTDLKLLSSLSPEAVAVLGAAVSDVSAALRSDDVDAALAGVASGDRLAANTANDAVRRYRNCVWALRVLLHRVLDASETETFAPSLSSRACCVARMLEARQLLQSLSTWCRDARLRMPRGAVTRWLLTSRLLEPSGSGDWLLPSSGGRDGGLEHELIRAGATPAVAQRIAVQLGAASRAAVARLRRVERVPSLDAGAREFVRCAEQLSDERRAELRRRFVGGEGGEAEFEAQLFCLLSTYAALGCEPKGGEGYHAAVTERTFGVLRDELGATGECFASPLNCTLARFSSAFGGAFERCFGSGGSFFDAAHCGELVARGGVYEANPPFLEEHMLAMALVLEHCLRRCAAPLTFVVFVPQWRDSPYFELLQRSRFTRFARDALKGEHEYVRGFGHLPPSHEKPVLVSYADTTVFVLENDAALAERPVSEAQVDAIMRSMKKPS